MNDPTTLVLNVRVTENLAGAERRLRETWGGGAVRLPGDAHRGRAAQDRYGADVVRVTSALRPYPGTRD